MIETIESVNSVINGFVWGPVMLLLLVGTGILLTIRAGFPQLTKLGTIMKSTVGSLFGEDAHKKDEAGISPYQAVATALASTVGTGNITGVATAIVAGGPGAVFWMWVSALFGTMTKFAEVTLAVKFRQKNERGEWVGGPMYYMENGLNAKWLGVIFACFATLASFGIGNMTQSNSIATALNETVGISPVVTGVVVAIIVAFVILGGIKRIAEVTERLVPVMGVIYVLLGVITIALNLDKLPGAFAIIFQGAFAPQSVLGGVMGYTIMNAIRFGFARGVFSNEAGLGSAPIAHAAANTDNPVKQGMWGAFEVIFDTFIICTITSLVVVMSGMYTAEGLDGAALSIAAFNQSVGMFGTVGVTIGTVLFALSTLLGWSYYGEKSIEYLFKTKSWVGNVKLGYRVVFIVMSFVGAVGGLQLIWAIADTLNGLMAIPNLIALVLLSGTVTKLVKDYFRELKENKAKA
mgnify:CR=1 FL=1